MLVFVLLAGAAGPVHAEENAGFSYDFDLRFHLNADVFPLRNKAHMQGYADFLDILEFCGNISGSAATGSIDLNGRLIPLNRPDAVISFRLFGVPEHLCLSSPLLGSETLWFQNYVLMEFAYKTWNNLHLPLSWVAMLFPYVTENAFSRLAEAWYKNAGNVSPGQSVSKKTLLKIAGEWSSVLQDDSRLYYWINALAAPSGLESILSSEFYALPAYLTDTVSKNGALKVRKKNGSIQWVNQDQDILFSSSETEEGLSLELDLPVTANGYVPGFSFSSRGDGNSVSFAVAGDYSRYYPGDEVLPNSLVTFSLSADSLPVIWPSESAFSAALHVAGSLFPNMDFTLQGVTGADGSVRLSLYQKVNEKAEATEVFTCSGSVSPVSDFTVPSFRTADLIKNTHVFSVSDTYTDPVERTIGRPLIYGLLNFLDALPARACQSVMDDLEDWGILDILVSTR